MNHVHMDTSLLSIFVFVGILLNVLGPKDGADHKDTMKELWFGM